MQQLDKENNLVVSTSDAAAQLVEIIPLIMRRIRSEMHLRTMPGLSVPQFRTLHYLMGHPQASLSELAEFLGLSLPSTSKLVQKLVTQKIVTRRGAADRRRVCLSLTERGRTASALAHLETRQQLAANLQHLSPEELETVTNALSILRRAFAKGSADVNVS